MEGEVMDRALHLSLSERHHPFGLDGHPLPRRVLRDDHISPTMMRIMDRLSDTPALVMSRFGEALLQTRLAVGLLGDYTKYTGMSRYLVYRWFTDDPIVRSLYPLEDHPVRGRVFTAEFRAAYTAEPEGRAGEIVAALLEISPEFAEIWRLHEVGVVHHHDLKRYRHPQLGEMELYCQPLVDPEQSQELLVFTATPGSPSHEKLQRLATEWPPDNEISDPDRTSTRTGVTRKR
jgi:hypothetical protein